MSRFLTNEGIYFVVFDGDIALSSDSENVIMRSCPKVGAGEKLPEDYVHHENFPHTILRFNSEKSIDILMSCLKDLKNQFKKEES